MNGYIDRFIRFRVRGALGDQFTYPETYHDNIKGLEELENNYNIGAGKEPKTLTQLNAAYVHHILRWILAYRTDMVKLK